MAARVKLFGKLLSMAHLLGIMPKEEYLQPGSGLIRILYGAYQLWPVVFMIPLLLSQIAALYRYWGDTVLILDIVGLMDGICMGLLVNVWGFLVCRKFCKLLEYLETDSVFNSPLVQQNPKLKQIFQKGQRKCTLFSRAIGFSICIAICFLTLSPIAIRYLELDGKVCQNIGNRSLTPRELFHQDGYDQFSIPIWLPVDPTRWYYEIWFLLLAAAVGSMRAMAPYSGMMIGMFVAVGLQFEIIVGLIDDIRDFPEHEKLHKVLEIAEPESDREEEAGERTPTVMTAKKYLTDVIRLHQKVLESSEEMDALQKPIVGGCLVLLVIMMIASMFQVTINPALTTKYALVLIGCLTHLYMYTLVGEYIAEQSERIGYAAYKINWYQRSRDFKRLIQILMSRCQKPCVWTLIVIVELKLVSFVDVSSMCYQVLMILLQLEETSTSADGCLE